MNNQALQVIPYLSFQGSCEEAVRAYIEAFSGQVHYLSRWTEHTCGGLAERVGKVMHVEFSLGQTRMAAGDSFEDAGTNTSIRLMIHMSSMEEALHAISILSEGGETLSPLQPHPEPDDGGCGSVTRDRFGYLWIITCPNPAKQ